MARVAICRRPHFRSWPRGRSERGADLQVCAGPPGPAFRMRTAWTPAPQAHAPSCILNKEERPPLSPSTMTTTPATPVRDIEMTTLPNGVRVITEAMPHVRSISVGIWIGTGSRRESSEQNGISHFIEHMLFKGTTSRSAEDIARSVDSVGGNLDAFTAKELVCFNTKVLDQHLPLAFDVISDLVLHPLFRDEDIDKEKGVILEEIKMDADSPDYLVHEIFSANFWKDHPLGKPILGTRETVKRFDRQMIDEYYRAVYAPSNLLLTAAGNLKHDVLVKLVSQHFASLSPNGSPPADQVPATHARIALRNKKS